MKIKELKEIKGKNVKDLETVVFKLKTDLMKNAVKMIGSKEKNVKIARNIKKEIAQILTIIKTKN